MANDVEIRVTGTDVSGPTLLSAARNVQSLRDMVTRAGTSMRATAGHARRLSDELVGVAASARVADRGLARLDTEMLSAGRGAADLDRQIDELRQSLADLGNTKTIRLKFVDAERERNELREAFDATALLPDVIGQAGQLGGALGRGIGGAAGPAAASGLMSHLSAVAGAAGPAAAIGAPLAAGIGVWIGASISASIIGGVGVGGVIGGLKIAAQHSEVKSAAAALGAEFKATMQQAAVGFVPAAVQGIGVLRSHLGKARDDLESIFADSSRFVVPLAEGAGTAVRSILGGVRDLMEEADPVIASIADGLVRIGKASGDGLSSIADNAKSGARALSILFMVVEVGVRGFFSLVNALAETWEVMELLGAAMTGNVGNLAAIRSETLRAEKGNNSFAQSLDEILAGFEGESDAADDAAQALREYADATDRIVDQNLDAAEATLRYRDTLRQARDAADGRRRVTDKESESLLRLARQSNTLTDALEEQGATTEELAARQRTARSDFIATAMAMGHSRRRAEELADKYLKIPRKVSTAINADTGQAARNLRYVRDLIAQIRSKQVVITTVTRSEGRNVPIGDGIGGRAHGGITGAAAGGIRGNLTWVGEQGPELVELPPSTMVHPAGTSQRMMAAGGVPVTNRYEITVNVPPAANPAEAGRATVEAIRAYERGSGRGWRS